jgi:Rps23 Pro-64 3,4-dihydroxylase Tpa1-like proline 4-hydroxylase
MTKTLALKLSNTEFFPIPFPHFISGEVLDSSLASDLFFWLKGSDLWHLTKTSFYTQYEFSLLDTKLPDTLEVLLDSEFIDLIIQNFRDFFNSTVLRLVSLTAHKLVDGYMMGVHNDYIGSEESHRLVIQLNRSWEESNGGYLMLFNSKSPSDVSKLIRPIQNTGIGFEISQKSYHAVSKVHDFERYTLVYTFSFTGKRPNEHAD